MISLLPSVAPKDVDGAFAVLALLANSEAAQKRMAELQAVLAEINAREIAVVAREQEQRDQAAIAAAYADQLQMADDRVVKAAAAVQAREKDFDEKSQAQAAKLAARDAEITMRENFVAEEVERLGKLKKALDARGDQMAVNEAAVATLKADLEDRLAKFAALAGR